jgi:chromosome segregation ATPase
VHEHRRYNRPRIARVVTDASQSSRDQPPEHALATLEHELVKARQRAAKAEAAKEQLAATLDELETWRGELERRLAATTTELAEATAARAADQRELKRLRAALGEAGGKGSGNVLIAENADTVATQATEIELLVTELASVRAQLSRQTAAD